MKSILTDKLKAVKTPIRALIGNSSLSEHFCQSWFGQKILVSHLDGQFYKDWYSNFLQKIIIAGSLEAAYSLNWGAQKIWGKGGGETLAL